MTSISTALASATSTHNATAALVVGMFGAAVGDAALGIDLAYRFVAYGELTHVQLPSRITIGFDARNGSPTVNWAGIGSVDAKTAMAYAASIGEAVDVGNRLVALVGMLEPMGIHGDMEPTKRTAVLGAITEIARAARVTD